MNATLCRTTWQNAGPNEKASALDAVFPQCGCEQWSLVGDECSRIAPDESVARILTTPGHYREEDLISARLTAAWAGGVSLIRCGASDEEIEVTIRQLLTEQAEAQSLLGAAVVKGSDIQALGSPSERYFGTFHTAATGKLHHADILATMPSGTNSGKKTEQSRRRKVLRNLLKAAIVFESSVDELISKLRQAGI